MSELTDIDCDGNAQYIWLQEREDTCGPACVYMIERIQQKACPVGGENRIREICELLPAGYREGQGTSFTALALALRRIGISADAVNIVHFKDFTATRNLPFIAHIAWPGGGGHFVLCVARSKNGSLICLDPWFGLSEPKLDKLPGYEVTRYARSAVCLVNPIGGKFSGFAVLI